MLDPRFIRENSELVKRNYSRRKKPELLKLLEIFASIDEKLRILKGEIDNLRKERNEASERINLFKKEGKPIENIIKKIKSIPEEIKTKEEEYSKIEMELKTILSKLPNLIHEKVPYGKDASENKELKKVGNIRKFKFKPKTHIELLEINNWTDFDASAKISGKGFYVLKGDVALLNQALIRYAIDFMKKKKYTYIEPPLMLRKDVLFAALDQENFDNTIYRIDGEDLCLIGTSEHSLLGLFSNEIVYDLPKKYFSYTMCFRKEVGSHGINERGLWRTHQFNKVEQFIFCEEKDSWKFFDDLLKNGEDFFKSLKIPYRLLEICTGDLSLWKARSIDLEGWRPTTNDYGELGSLSNCTSYQSRELGIKTKDKEYVHTLNNTLVATSRALVAVLENYQEKDGSVKVPKVLVSYLGKKIIKG